MLPDEVRDAVKELDAAHDDRYAPWRDQWQTIRAHLLAREAEEVVAYAWRKPGMNGWALGHQPPTPSMPDFDKYEVRSLTFITAHLSENSRDDL